MIEGVFFPTKVVSYSEVQNTDVQNEGFMSKSFKHKEKLLSGT